MVSKIIERSGKMRFILVSVKNEYLFVNTVLLLRPIHLDRDLVLRLIDLDVITIGLQSRGYRLNAHFPVRDVIQRGFPVAVGLQFRPCFGLFSFFIDRMHKLRTTRNSTCEILSSVKALVERSAKVTANTATNLRPG